MEVPLSKNSILKTRISLTLKFTNKWLSHSPHKLKYSSTKLHNRIKSKISNSIYPTPTTLINQSHSEAFISNTLSLPSSSKTLYSFLREKTLTSLTLSQPKMEHSKPKDSLAYHPKKHHTPLKLSTLLLMKKSTPVFTKSEKKNQIYFLFNKKHPKTLKS